MPTTDPAVTNDARRPPFRVGHGYDLHRLAPISPAGPGRALLIGGVAFDSSVGPVAHSDGDALLHAVTDAALSAAGLPDIGQLFPDDDPELDGADSGALLRMAMERVREAGWAIGNIDCTVILERPRIGMRKHEIRASVARLLGVEDDCVGLKGKSHEGVDAVGRGQAIEVHCVALLIRTGNGA
jgi:2-C-methyl-D-erythritol 2,4-cyclodiphosphate synthase